MNNEWEDVLTHVLDARTYRSLNKSMHIRRINEVLNAPIKEEELVDAIRYAQATDENNIVY